MVLSKYMHYSVCVRVAVCGLHPNPSLSLSLSLSLARVGS